MLRQGALDAVIVGNEVPADPALRSGLPDPTGRGGCVLAHARRRCRSTTCVTVGSDLARRRPDPSSDLVRMFRAAEAAEPGTSSARPGVRSMRRRSLARFSLVLRYAAEQTLAACAPCRLRSFGRAAPQRTICEARMRAQSVLPTTPGVGQSKARLQGMPSREIARRLEPQPRHDQGLSLRLRRHHQGNLLFERPRRPEALFSESELMELGAVWNGRHWVGPSPQHRGDALRDLTTSRTTPAPTTRRKNS